MGVWAEKMELEKKNSGWKKEHIQRLESRGSMPSSKNGKEATWTESDGGGTPEVGGPDREGSFRSLLYKMSSADQWHHPTRMLVINAQSRPRVTHQIRISILKRPPGDLHRHWCLRDVGFKLIKHLGLMLRARKVIEILLRLVKESNLHIFPPAEWDQLPKRPKSRRSFLPWPTLIHRPMLTTSTSPPGTPSNLTFPASYSLFSFSKPLISNLPLTTINFKKKTKFETMQIQSFKIFLFSLVQKLMLSSCYATVLHSFKNYLFIHLFNTRNICIGV